VWKLPQPVDTLHACAGDVLFHVPGWQRSETTFLTAPPNAGSLIATDLDDHTVVIAPPALQRPADGINLHHDRHRTTGWFGGRRERQHLRFRRRDREEV
jgi:hypothetical protein